MKRIAIIALTLGLLCALTAGCAGESKTEKTVEVSQNSGNALHIDAESVDKEKAGTTTAKPSESGTEKTTTASRSTTEAKPSESAVDPAADETVLENVSFVMIYDPFIFDERDEKISRAASLFSGDMGPQIVTGLHRAGGLSEEMPNRPSMISQAEINKKLDSSGVERAAGRAGGQDPVYEEGKTHQYFCFDNSLNNRILQEFTCVYAGEHCYVWSLDKAVSEAEAKQVGEEFDSKIYQNNTAYFGTPRFTENGGKVNILFYSLPKGVGGFFCLYDIFSSQEAPRAYAEAYGLNTDHAIITINSDYLNTDMPFLNATLAHELQHLICASEAFNYVDSPFVRTWLDEAMSAYAEDLNYPGLKMENGYNELLYVSERYRKGQSLYNFEIDSNQDIGAYGVVYLFDRYLINHTGEDVFRNIHHYWKESYSATVTEADALYASVSEEFKKRISEEYSFPAAISAKFATEAEEWMSKMTLDFFLEAVELELAELTDYADKARLFMLYSEIDPLYLEGGGRIIVSVENGSFTIPKDSEKGLIYIGFDDKFNIVTSLYSNIE